MNEWQNLTRTALLGTDKKAFTPSASQSEIGLLLSELANNTSAEQQLLRSAGVLALCHLAGWVPQAIDPAPLPEMGEENAQTINNPAFAGLLHLLLSEGPPRLLWSALDLLVRRQLLPPPLLLPALLNYGAQKPSLRSILSNVLGARGCWLAQINADWGYVLASTDAPLDEEMWLHGTSEQRLQYLTQMRIRAPEQGRDRLAQEMSSLDARERAQLLAVLEVGISQHDEAFLEQTLSDRSKEVRQTAARLLCCLPESAWISRMKSRLAPLLSSSPAPETLLERLKGLSGKEKMLRVALDAPEAFLPEWKADALEETKPKGEKLGQRAWWLYQIVAAVPLDWWQTQLQATPVELLRWAGKTDWQEALLRAWYNAVLREKNPQWAQAFLALLPVGISIHSPAGVKINAFELLQCLPVEEHEPVLTLLFSVMGGEHLQRYIALLPLNASLFSSRLSKQMVMKLHRWVQQDTARYDYALRHVMSDFACLLAPEVLNDVIDKWPRDAQQTPYCEAAFTALSAALAHRIQLNSLFVGETTL
ncbi:TPA: DUF5691 domain-containing protein [Escherichia coli]